MGNERKRLQAIITSTTFEYVVIGAIVINAVTLGLETDQEVMSVYGPLLMTIDLFFVMFFTSEITLRLIALGRRFFNEGWNWFDLLIVTLTLIPYLGITALGNLSVLRAVRILRLLAVIPALRRVLFGIGQALAASMAVMVVMCVIFYIYGILTVKLFRDISPELFADLPAACFALFQIMTLDAWSDIVRPLMEVHWWAGLFFIAFIVKTVFILLSIVIGIASNAMAETETNKK